ncbi:MAG: adenylate/guanylate cyclase domain-containing protein [Angelakisella sp.]
MRDKGKSRGLPSLRRMMVAALAAGALAILAASGLLSTVDNALSDLLFQRAQALDGNIVLIGIDQRAIEKLGRFQDWDRDVLAQALETLNADPSNRPAVIGVDVLFSGETTPEQDNRLAEAAGRYGNVVTAANGNFGSQLVEQENGSFGMDDFTVIQYEEPYSQLKNSTSQGHINAMLDVDGVLRHALLQIELPDGRVIPSFHQQIYRQYAQKMGLDPEVTPPTNARHFWYLPFRADPGGYDDGLSIADLLSGELPSDLFADKIVLIGPYTTGLQDAYPPSIDHAERMYGVEYQANAIDAMIYRDFKQEISTLWQAVVLFVICFLCLLWFRDCKVLPATAVWLLLSVGSVGVALLAWNAGYILHLLYLPLSVTVLYIATVALNYIRAAVEKQRVTSTFKRYVAPEIVNELLREDPTALALGGKLTNIAVLFVDIRGFTAMSEVLEPAQVVEVLNRYLTLTSSCILENGGTLDKFIGDCTMAFWGAPLPQNDCIYKAVKAALDMVAGAQALTAALEAQFGRAVSFGIGVHYGPAIVGNIGAPVRMDYTAIGDTVNTASRLESNAPGGKILVSRVVADELAGRIAFTPLGGSIPLKGKAEGFEVFSVEGEVVPCESEL